MSLDTETQKEASRRRQRLNELRYAATARGAAKRLLSNAKQNSKQRGSLPPTITREWILSKLDGVCPISGLPFEFTGEAHNPRAPSLDRIDCSLPYTPENTRVVLWAVNMGRGVWGSETYLAIAAAALRHNGLQAPN